MKEKTSPIKRSVELAPLSREHHDGLLFVWKIRQGLSNGTSIDLIAKYVSWFWHNHIKPHFHDEEKVLLEFLPAINPLVKQMADEHAQIRDMILSLDKEVEAEKLRMLANFVDKHIRFEERKLFPYAEKTLTSEQLKHIFSQLDAEVVCESEWKEEFWVKKKDSPQRT